LQPPHLTNIKRIFVIVILIILVVIYTKYNPNKSSYFPKCPFLSITGYKCVGCGSQRAIHSLLNFEFLDALYYNVLLVIFIPYLMIGFLLELLKLKFITIKKIYNAFFNTKTIFFILVLFLCFWIIRNTPFWMLN